MEKLAESFLVVMTVSIVSLIGWVGFDARHRAEEVAPRGATEMAEDWAVDRTVEGYRLTIDKSHGQTYIALTEERPPGCVARTVEIAPHIYVDEDASGRPIGIEITFASELNDLWVKNW